MRAASKSVLVLHEAIKADARPDELDTLVQVGQVSDALQELGWRVAVLAVDLDLAAARSFIREHQPACAFNLVESLAGDGQMIHFLPALLRAIKMPFTGSDSDAIYLSSHKLLAKQWMRLHGIATPPHFTQGAQADGDNTRWIVKSVWEHASFGLDDGCVVTGLTAARLRIEQCQRTYGGSWFAEQFVDGREFNISLLEQNGRPHILPLAEMTFVDYPQGKPKIVSYAAKWDEDAPEYHATRRTFPALSDGLRDAIGQTVQQCWDSFGLRGYARVDIRMDAAGVPWVLEINANPCLARDAGFTATALQAGISYGQLIDQVIQAALRTEMPLTHRKGKLPAQPANIPAT